MPDIVIETRDLRKHFGKPDAKDKRGRPKGVRHEGITKAHEGRWVPS
jgi:hypothetical protein